MRTHSAGLEIRIKLSDEEIKTLAKKPLRGTLNFREVNEDSIKPINFCLIYVPNKPYSIIVGQSPNNCYLGNAKRIAILLSNDLYSTLINNEYCGDRFGIGGRVDIFRQKQFFK